MKCPKCSQPMVIQQKGMIVGQRQVAQRPAEQPQTSLSVSRPTGHNPLLDLLDEAGVEAVPQGPICENCGADMEPNAVICVECGFNIATGVKLETEQYEDSEESYSDNELTDAEKIMAKAEREIDDMPVTAVGQNFGDGADSILIALVSMVALGILVAIGLAIILLMDIMGDAIDSAMISFYASIGMYVLCVVWITIVAFLAKPVQGIICVCTGGLYCIVFGFMTRGLVMPAIILCASVLIGLVSSIFAFAPKSEFGMQIQPIQSFLGQLIALSL
ncbi:MAG: hypothetical protein MK108_04875 [Mariniblastus sp.]|nr:hypothetical protein [Mariniblastus sp.]